MPAPECTCRATYDLHQPGVTHFIYCPLHKAAGDLYTALQPLIDALVEYGETESDVVLQARAALLKANPQRIPTYAPKPAATKDPQDPLMRLFRLGRGWLCAGQIIPQQWERFLEIWTEIYEMLEANP